MMDGKLLVAFILLSFPILIGSLLKDKLKDYGLLFITGLSLLCFGLISLYPDKVARMAAPFFPLFILSTILALWASYQMLRLPGKPSNIAKTTITALLLLGMVIPGTMYGYRLTQVTTGYSAVASKIEQLLKPGESVATPLLWPIYTNYMQQKVYHFVDFTKFKKAMKSENNVRYLVFDMQNLTHITKYCQPDSLQCPYPKEFKEVDAIENYLVQHHAKQWRFFNPVTRDFQFYLEEHQPIAYSQYLLAHTDDTQYGYIRIYEVPVDLNLRALQQATHL
jgi:hypothetical protein